MVLAMRRSPNLTGTSERASLTPLAAPCSSGKEVCWYRQDVMEDGVLGSEDEEEGHPLLHPIAPFTSEPPFFSEQVCASRWSPPPPLRPLTLMGFQRISSTPAHRVECGYSDGVLGFVSAGSLASGR
jgi:hypothetical protein